MGEEHVQAFNQIFSQGEIALDRILKQKLKAIRTCKRAQNILDEHALHDLKHKYGVEEHHDHSFETVEDRKRRESIKLRHGHEPAHHHDHAHHGKVHYFRKTRKLKKLLMYSVSNMSQEDLAESGFIKISEESDQSSRESDDSSESDDSVVFKDKRCIEKVEELEEKWPHIFDHNNRKELKKSLAKRLQTARTERQFERKVAELLDEMRRQQMQHDVVSGIKSLDKARKSGSLNRIQERGEPVHLVDFLKGKLSKEQTKAQRKAESGEASETQDGKEQTPDGKKQSPRDA